MHSVCVICELDLWLSTNIPFCLNADSRFISIIMSRANQAGQQNWKISEESQQTIQKQYMYRNDPKFSDRYAWANSADPV